MEKADALNQFERFLEMSKQDGRFVPSRDDHCLCVNDDTENARYESPSGVYAIHYILHTGWAARRLRELGPMYHVDFGSSLYFVGIASAWCDFIFCDIRPAKLPFKDEISERAENLTALHFDSDCLPSISCLHVLEHIGLGRYGDTLDAQGDRKAAKELSRVLAPGGRLLLAVPMEDPPRVIFNSERRYSYQQVIDLFDSLTLLDFSLITEKAKFIPHAGPSDVKGQFCACGCFEFVKP
jgi:SAM-dependent methyltransferase